MKELKAKLKLEDIVEMPNIAAELDESDQMIIAKEVVSFFERDKDSRRDWEMDTDKALELAGLKKKAKNTPWPNASNVKYPLITNAAMQFAARTMPEIIRNGKVVEAFVVGSDPDGSKMERAKRVSTHMSYQLLVANSEFEETTDRLLHMLPIVGTVFKKTYFDPVKQRNVSELCLHDEIFIHNDVKSLDEARRVTHLLFMHKNDIIEKIRTGLYSDVPDEAFKTGPDELSRSYELQEVLEQHTYLDLDGDGYEEPYIVTVLKEGHKVLRIVARFDPEDMIINDKDEVVNILPVQYFTDYHFIPSPDGTFFSIGFGQLMFAINESVNTILNQLIDAGTLATMQGGFLGRGLRIKGGQLRMRPGQWHKLDSAGIDDIRKHIVPLSYKEPSNVLFQLLGALIDAGKELSSVNDAMLGREQVQNVAASSIMSSIEQGTKVFSSIQRRMYRSFKKEFEKHYRLNRIFLDPQEYMMVLDNDQANLENDYDDESLDVKPVADPNMSSETLRLLRSQDILEKSTAFPELNKYEALKLHLEALNTPNIDMVLPKPDPNAAPPPEIIEMMSKIDAEGKKLQLKGMQYETRNRDTEIREYKAEFEAERMRAEAMKMMAEAEKAMAEAQAAKTQAALAPGIAQVDALAKGVPAPKEDKAPEGNANEGGDIQAMGPGPGDTGAAQ